MTAQKMSAQEIIAFIGMQKKTNVKVTFEGIGNSCSSFCYETCNVLFGDWKDIEPFFT